MIFDFVPSRQQAQSLRLLVAILSSSMFSVFPMPRQILDGSRIVVILSACLVVSQVLLNVDTLEKTKIDKTAANDN